MKKIFQNKAIILLFVLMLGFTFLKSTSINSLEEGINSSSNSIVYKNA
ncbi:MAG: hypothetical protein PHD02_01010 [Bacilli bacterium]|nr:hypothetical protein [Bacilli bacterium]